MYGIMPHPTSSALRRHLTNLLPSDAVVRGNLIPIGINN